VNPAWIKSDRIGSGPGLEKT